MNNLLKITILTGSMIFSGSLLQATDYGNHWGNKDHPAKKFLPGDTLTAHGSQLLPNSIVNKWKFKVMVNNYGMLTLNYVHDAYRTGADSSFTTIHQDLTFPIILGQIDLTANDSAGIQFIERANDPSHHTQLGFWYHSSTMFMPYIFGNNLNFYLPPGAVMYLANNGTLSIRDASMTTDLAVLFGPVDTSQPLPVPQ
jgi:hypothetical protein